jgi:hypothetical protein
MERLANDFLALAVDPRGFGMSDAQDSQYDAGTVARDLSQVMAKFSDELWTVEAWTHWAPEIYAEPWSTRERLLAAFAYNRGLERTVSQNQTGVELL